ncbi:MAG: DUF3179 domain-containing protein [Spirochaetota bacterium]
MRHLVLRVGPALLAMLAATMVFAGGDRESAGTTPQAPSGDVDSNPGGGGSTPAGRRGLVEGGIEPVPGFTTDFSRSIVPGSEIISGGPPKDGIPAIDDPRFIPVDDVDWLGEDEPVFVVTAGGDTHIYPLQILTYHEIVNDEVGGVPLAVTYCPLCNTGIVFDRRHDGRVLDFGTTGRLRYSNLLMYDRQSESWWQQATGQGVVGRYAGEQLSLHPSLMLPWDVASARHAEASVLSRETGYSRAYGSNPYTGYDTSTRPFLYRGPEVGSQYNPMARVVQVVVGGESLAVAYPVLEERGLVQERVGGEPVVVLWEPGTASALDARSIRSGRDVGSANAFRAIADGEALSFAPSERANAPERRFVDDETGSVWNASGLAVEGPLAGTQLEPLVGIQHFWFSYSAFETDAVWEPSGE